VRRVRIDFGAQLEFLDADALRGFLGGLDPGELGLGTLDALQARGNGNPGEGDLRYGDTHAALACIHYPETEVTSMLVLVKPTLSRDLPVDVQRYAKVREQFPQESTGDQFFSEAQWESYRKLGESIGLKLFRHGFGPFFTGGRP
jgi:hypothetical protein